MNQMQGEPNDVSSRLHHIANGLGRYGHPMRSSLLRAAQQVVDLGEHGGGEGDFDPASEPPPIESFVKRPQGGALGAPNQIHTATVSFLAPSGFPEDEIMEYILSIREHLKVRVKSFNWSVADEKPKGASARLGLLRAAQQVVDLGEYGGGEGDFDPSSEPPPIESFAKPSPQGGGALGAPNQIHTATVSFLAPNGFPEDEIMEYILSIRESLKVRVKSFNWSVADEKRKGE